MGPPGCDNPPIAAVGMGNNAEVLAFFSARSTEPSQAPSIRWKAMRFPAVSTTAMFIATPMPAAASWPADRTRVAVSRFRVLMAAIVVCGEDPDQSSVVPGDGSPRNAAGSDAMLEA